MKFIKNKSNILLLFSLVLSIGLISCSDNSQKNKPSEKPQFKTKEEAISSIYNSFLYEKTICQCFVEVIAGENEFINNFKILDAYQREDGKRVFQMLSKSKVAKNEVVQYVLKNSDYFLIDVDFHGGPGMVYVKDSPIFCMQTDKRLKELEAFAPSEQSWKVREHYLNLALDSILEFGMHGYEGPVGCNFETLQSEVDITKKKYSQQFREPLKSWVQKASTRLRERVKHIDDEFVPKEQQLSEIEKWIAELKKGLE